MTQWSGKSKGNLLGYKIFVYCIKKIGIKAAYTVLVFVAFYYLFFSWKSTAAVYDYLRRRKKLSIPSALIGIYKSYFTFGQVLIDKIAISAGLRNKFTYEFDGIEILKDLLAQKKGGVLISAHVGNFEIAERFFADIDLDCQINLVVADLEHSAIKNYIESISEKSAVKFIIVKEDLSHIFEINNALSNNELVCFTGDRYFEGSKIMEEELLGSSANFPAGPFLIASRLKVPVAFVYVMKEKNLHYHLYTRLATFKQIDAQILLKEYTKSVENILEKYPFQWFNYFKFWK